MNPIGRKHQLTLLSLQLRVARGLAALRVRLVERVRRRLTPETARALTSLAYASKGHYAQSWHGELGLFDFEEAAIGSHFPPAPARVLVPGCGAGRELVALAARGYVVAGSDPDTGMLDAARARLGPDVQLETGWLQDLVDDAELLEGPWDAIIVGWGAVGHLLEDGERRAVLSALRARTDGPVLISWRVAPRQGLRGYAHSSAAAHANGPPRVASWSDRLVVGLDGLVDIRLDREQITDDAVAAGFGTVHYMEPGEFGFPSAVLLP